MQQRIPLLAIAALVTLPAFADGDPAAGQRAFEGQCVTCHSIKGGQQSMGPNLLGVFGRKAGSVPGQMGSKALAASDLVWDDATLDRYLARPGATVPGTSKGVTVSDEQQRADLIAYLRTLK